MKQSAFALLLFINGLILGSIGGYLLRGDPAGPAAQAHAANRYVYEQQPNGRLAFFDQATGQYTAFNQHEGLWFVMVYDPDKGSVTYKETILIEDPTFLKAAERLKDHLPERLGRELQLERLLE